MSRSPLILLVPLLVSPALAQSIYTWTDADGTAHYTNDPSSVPRGQQVTAVVSTPNTTGTVSTVTSGPLPTKAPAAADASVATPPAPVAVDEPRVPGTSEAYWRGQFRTLHAKLRQLEDEISVDAREVEDNNGLMFRGRMRCGYQPTVPSQVPGTTVVVGGGAGTPGLVVSGSGQVVVAGAGQVPGVTTVVPMAVSQCWYANDPEYERVKHRLAVNRLAHQRAREELEELDRRASFESVPREWRR